MSEPKFSLAPQGVFRTVQGEGHLSGLPMVFVRLAGCPVGCSECDTDYSVSHRIGLGDLLREVIAAASSGTKWVWLTGGEPLIQNIQPLIQHLHHYQFKVAVATAGIREVVRGNCLTLEGGVSKWSIGCNFLSVSPHRFDDLVQWRGEQVNLVFGLNGLSPEQAEPHRKRLEEGFSYLWVTPCEGKPETFQQCLEWVYKYPEWRIGIQAHKVWGLS